jgi:hypothetical protein
LGGENARASLALSRAPGSFLARARVRPGCARGTLLWAPQPRAPVEQERAAGVCCGAVEGEGELWSCSARARSLWNEDRTTTTDGIRDTRVVCACELFYRRPCATGGPQGFVRAAAADADADRRRERRSRSARCRQNAVFSSILPSHPLVTS